MKKELLLYPKFFGPNIQDLLVEKLIQNVEGSCSGRYGFVVCVTDVIDVGKGKIREGGLRAPRSAAAASRRARRRRAGAGEGGGDRGAARSCSSSSSSSPVRSPRPLARAHDWCTAGGSLPPGV